MIPLTYALSQGGAFWYTKRVSQSTITEKFQTTIPLEVRQALKLAPHQKVAYELRPDGSAVMRPVPRLDELFGSLRLNKHASSTREEKRAARDAIAREAAGEALK